MNDNIADTAAKVTTFSGLAATTIGGLALAEWLALGGFIVTLVGVGINFWHKRAIVRLEREKWEFEKASKQ